jgi:hypothetical protein
VGEWKYSSTILDLAVDGSEWSASRPFRLTLTEIAPDVHWVVGLVGLSRSGRCGADKNLLLLPGIELRPSFPSLYRLRYSGFYVHGCGDKFPNIFNLSNILKPRKEVPWMVGINELGQNTFCNTVCGNVSQLRVIFF